MAANEAEIEEGLRRLAILIDAYGDQYWPLFERLEEDLISLRTRKQRLLAYLPSNKSQTKHKGI